MTKAHIIRDSAEKGISYEAYGLLLKDLADTGKTTGPDQSPELVGFTKLNASRMRRLDKKVVVPSEAIRTLRTCIREPQLWLVITESWCGDAAQTIPVLHRITEAVPDVRLQMVMRDENPGLTDLFLTGGARSIPKLIILNRDFRVLHTWGPRSVKATTFVEAYRKEHGKIDAALKESLQIWYNRDMGQAIIEDLVQLLCIPCTESK